tara:strand:- start:4621 stop:4851 length:231 start_codon:yes stop_codon:yes gene_type:complete
MRAINREKYFPTIAEVKFNPLRGYSVKRANKEIKKWEGRGYSCIWQSDNGGHRKYQRSDEENITLDCLANSGIQVF